MSEADIQKELFERFKAEYPEYIKSFQASLNGVQLGRNRFAIINSLKAQGMCVGQSDIFLAIPRAGFCGKYIELKTLTGKPPTQDQLDFGDAMLEQGYLFEVAKGLDAGWDAIKTYVDCEG
jgi:hypothetical protein